jgi:hypothetical protein
LPALKIPGSKFPNSILSPTATQISADQIMSTGRESNLGLITSSPLKTIEQIRKRGNASAMRPSINNGRDSLLSMGDSMSQLHPKISYSALKERFLSPTLKRIG